MNLGQLIGGLRMQLDEALEAKQQSEGKPIDTRLPQREPRRRGHPTRKDGEGVSGKIRQVLRGAHMPLNVAAIASASGLTNLQVATNIVCMKDVKRVVKVSSDKKRVPYCYFLKGLPCDSADSA